MVWVLSLLAASRLLILRLVRLFVKAFVKAGPVVLGGCRLGRPGRSGLRIASALAGASGWVGPWAKRTPSRQPGYREVVLDRLAFHARRVLGAERVCLLALDSRESRRTDAVIVTQVGRSFDRVGGNTRVDTGLAALALGCGRPAVSPPRAGPPRPPRECGGQGWQAAAPLSDPIAPRRVLIAGWAESDPAPGLAELELSCEFASLASQAIRHQRDAEVTACQSQPNIQALSEALAAQDGATWRHSVQVAELATRVAKRLELGHLDQLEVRLAALLHDIGKLRLPEELLRRPGPLSPAEWKLMRRHPEWGAETLAAIPGLEAVAMIVRLHHERPDGGGYPHRLASERIPTASQIVAVCDAYCAMTSGRPYQPSRSPNETLRELEGHAGTQFDDQIVSTLRAAVTSHLPLAA